MYKLILDKSNALNYIDMDGCIKLNQAIQQNSYNLPQDFLRDAIYSRAIVVDYNIEYSRKDKDGPAYVLAPDYKLEFGRGIQWLVGFGVNNYDNKFIASTGSNGVTQLFTSVYYDLSKKNPDYLWFTHLYNRNLVGSVITIDIDIENKAIIMDTRINIF